MLGDGTALGRIGGEEFAALLPDCDEGEALRRAESLRAAIEASDFRPADRMVPLRVSVGVAALERRDGNFEALLQRADAALYAAKRAGRNRVMPASALAASTERARPRCGCQVPDEKLPCASCRCSCPPRLSPPPPPARRCRRTTSPRSRSRSMTC